jgi:hypothetical protein
MRTPSATEEQISKLKDQVYRLRELVFALMPAKARAVLEQYTSGDDRASVRRWLNEAADKIVDLAERRPASEMGEYMGSGERAYCPLCGGGASGPYIGKGFAWPEGLRRHLLGDYNSHECNVMEAVREAALDLAESTLLDRLRVGSKHN